METPKLLVIVDTSLGEDLLAVIREKIPDAVLEVIWDPICIADKTRRRQAKAEAHERIRAGSWDALLSLYQEFILKDEDLATTRLALNVHPSRPQIPGMSYDTGPLIEGSASFGHCGGTLHFMTRGIDEGQVIRVEETVLPPDADYRWVRQRNQRFCLSQTAWLCDRIAEAEDVDSLERRLRTVAAETNRCWGEYISNRDLNATLSALWEMNPNHPVFEGNKKFRKRLDTAPTSVE